MQHPNGKPFSRAQAQEKLNRLREELPRNADCRRHAERLIPEADAHLKQVKDIHQNGVRSFLRAGCARGENLKRILSSARFEESLQRLQEAEAIAAEVREVAQSYTARGVDIEAAIADADTYLATNTSEDIEAATKQWKENAEKSVAKASA